jgi:thymidylate kinase
MDRCNFISDIVYGESLGVDLTTIQKMHACIESPPLIDMLFVFKCCDEVLEIRRKARNERCRIERYGDDYLKRVNKSYSTILETHGYYLKNFVKSKQVNGICGSPARTILHAEYVDVSMPVGEVVRTIIEKIKINQGI